MFWRRKRSQTDFSSEVQSHIALETDRLRSTGLSEEEARSQAHQLFGNILHSEERFYESRRDCLAESSGKGFDLCDSAANKK